MAHAHLKELAKSESLSSKDSPMDMGQGFRLFASPRVASGDDPQLLQDAGNFISASLSTEMMIGLLPDMFPRRLAAWLGLLHSRRLSLRDNGSMVK